MISKSLHVPLSKLSISEEDVFDEEPFGEEDDIMVIILLLSRRLTLGEGE